MPSWKILPLIRSLDERGEVDAFRLWLAEKSRSSQSYVAALFEQLLVFIQSQKEDTLTSEYCWTLIRPHDPYQAIKSDGKLRQYKIELKERIQRFWLEKALDQKDDDLVRLMTFRELGKRNLYDLLEKAYHLEADKWKEKEVLGIEDLYFLFHAEQWMTEPKVKEIRIKTTPLPKVIERFIEYSLSTYLKLACINLSESNTISQSYEPIFLDELMDMLDKKEMEPSDGLLYVYFHIYRFLSTQSDKIDLILHALRPENTTLSPPELSTIYALLHNGVVKRMNIGGFQKWAPRLLLLYQWGVDAKAMLQNELIDPRYYKNIVVTALRLDHKQKAWHFMEALRQYLPSEADEYYRFCKGYFYYSTKEYQKMKSDEAWTVKEPFKNTGLRISADLVWLQTEYEQKFGIGEEEDIDKIKEKIQKLSRFVKAQKNLGKMNKESWLTRLRFFKQLLKPLDKKGLEALYKEILTADLLGNRDWFFYQIQWRLDVMEI